MKLRTYIHAVLCGLTLTIVSCMDLNQEPLSSLPPQGYLETEAELNAYVMSLYPALPSWSTTNNWDNNTDNMANKGYDNKYVPGQWKVGQSGGDWSFSKIYKCNYMIESVETKLESTGIQGNKTRINQHLGEAYFFRAFEYFYKLQSLGDFPILEKTLPNDMDRLVAESKRAPRTDVAHFILSDLDKAIELLMEKPDSRKNEISKNVARLFKSRVALYEGTWMKYFKNTPFVPNGPGWPGAAKDYNKNYEFPKGSIDAEIDFFLTEAVNESKTVADATALVTNTGTLPQSEDAPENPYLSMFSDVDMSKYSEVLLWRKYSKSQSIMHSVAMQLQVGNGQVGLTRGYVDSYLMKNGLPIYASASGYHGDDQISDVRKDRDNRLWLFMKEPGQKNVLKNEGMAVRGNLVESYPNITSSDYDNGYSTGYSIRKGGTFDGEQLAVYGECWTGSVSFRGAEAYLNYMEAIYERDGKLDATAENYWRQLRDRALVDNDYSKTIAATVMAEEAKNDWGAYSAGELIDPTLYNIRRERRSELLNEGLRMTDLKRWRALDQLITKPYNLEGFKIWGPMQDEYKDSKGKSTLISEGENANVSSPNLSQYLRPQETSPKSLILKNGGYKWIKAHYLSPIAIGHFLITGGVESSHLYQNPYWPTRANEGPLE